MSDEIAFALPGPLEARTGGTRYDLQLVAALRALGQPVRVVTLPGHWPEPADGDAQASIDALHALPRAMPVIIDGLAFGAMDTAAARALGRPVTVMLHHPLGLEPGMDPARAQALMTRERGNLAHADAVIVPSAHVHALLLARFGLDAARIRVAPPGFTRPERGAAPADPPLILSVGLICARKGHDVLLQALGRLADLRWQAVIAGAVQDAALFERLQSLRGALGLDARVALPGAVPQAELDALFARARVFALATRYEGYAMVLSEAQLHGLAVVTCETGAVPGTLGGAGVMVPPDDAPAFAAALRRVLTQPALRADLSARSSACAARLPDWEDAGRVTLAALAQARAHFG